MRTISIWNILFLLPIYLSCSNGDEKKTDSGQETDTGADTGTNSGTDTDTETDADTETDNDTDTVVVSDAGSWDWEDLHEGEDCGEGCRQLTFTKNVRWEEWDVWGDLLTYNDDETYNTHMVNYSENKQLLLPNFYPEYGIGPSMGSANMYPTVYKETVCYSKSVWDANFSDIICADIDAKQQKLVDHRTQQGGEFPNPANYSDLYENRFVSMGGCSEVMDSWPLCFFDISAPGIYEEIEPTRYGSRVNIWGDILIWYTEADGIYDIKGYDFSTKTTFNITDDEEEDQFMCRIHGNYVVYQDLRYGDNSDPTMGDWNHSVVFAYNIQTKQAKQITSQDWISAYPDVYGDIVVWADYRDSTKPNDKNSLAGVQIWGYNLSTEIEFQITNIPSRAKSTPRIWEDKVFVHMYKAAPVGEDAIYMFDLPEGAK